MVPAAVLTNSGSTTVIITSALLDALITPPLLCTITGDYRNICFKYW